MSERKHIPIKRILMGECKITEKIHTEPLDLSDAKFIDEKGHTINRDDALDWNETPPCEESEGKE